MRTANPVHLRKLGSKTGVSVDTSSACSVVLVFVGLENQHQGQQDDFEPRGGLFTPWGPGRLTKLLPLERTAAAQSCSLPVLLSLR